MPIDLRGNILRNAAKWLRMVEGRPYQLQWRGVEQARTLCKQIGVDISEAAGTTLYPNIRAAHEVIQQAINKPSQKGTE